MMDFPHIQSLLKRVTAPGTSDFYRRLYGLTTNEPALHIQTIEEWRALPPVTKDDLIKRTLAERSCIPLEEVDHLRTSSGTSGKQPLFCPRTHVRGLEYRLQYHDFKNAFLAYTTPMMPHWHEQFQRENHGSPCVIAYDPKTPDACARIARDAGVDGISVFVFHIPALGEALKRAGINEKIRFLEVTGEICTMQIYEYMRKTFPNATILQSYGASEVEDVHMGIPCKPMDGSDPLALYHPKDTHYLEIIDTETGEVIEPKAGAEGDLLITAYPDEPSAFPLLRFRIGDTIRIIDDMCPHGSWSFTILGRTDMDVIKLPGGVLRADEIARVLRLFPAQISDRFSLHWHEQSSPGGPIPAPILHVDPRKEVDLTQLATDIAKNLRIGPTLTYEGGVAQGRFAPLTCVPLQYSSGEKTKRIVRHI